MVLGGCRSFLLLVTTIELVTDNDLHINLKIITL